MGDLDGSVFVAPTDLAHDCETREVVQVEEAHLFTGSILVVSEADDTRDVNYRFDLEGDEESITVVEERKLFKQR